jgi:hypothetical protein
MDIGGLACSHFRIKLTTLYLRGSYWDSLDGGSARRKAVTNVGEHKRRKTQAYNHALSGIRTHDLNVLADLDGMTAVTDWRI